MSGTTLVQVPARMNELGRIGTVGCALENRCGFRVTVGSNPTPSARNGHFPRATVGPRTPSDRSSDRNQRAAASTGLAKSAAARGDVTGAGPRVCPGVAALGRDGRDTRLGPTRRPLATVSARVAGRGWGEWVERFADNGERARSGLTHMPAKVTKSPRHAVRPRWDASGLAGAQLQHRWEGPSL